MRRAALAAALLSASSALGWAAAPPRHGAGGVSAAERRREVRHFCDLSCGGLVDAVCYTQCASEVQACLADSPDRGGCARDALALYANFDRNWAQAQSPLADLCAAPHQKRREAALSGKVRRVCDAAGRSRCAGVVPACYKEGRGKLRSWGASTCRGDVRAECKAVQRARAATRRVHRLLALRAGAGGGEWEAHLASAGARKAARSLCDEACSASGESSCHTECETELYNCNLAHVPPGGEMLPEGEEHEECRREVAARYESYGEDDTPHDTRS